MAPAITSASSSEHGGNKATVINGVPTFVPRNRLTALLADGDKSCRMMQKGMLRYYGVQTQDVSNGKAVVDLLASASTFDLIVIDIVLPVVNGLEAIRQIRSMGMTTKIVGMSIVWTERDRQALLDAGVNKAIEKPLSPETLVPILMEIDGQV